MVQGVLTKVINQAGYLLKVLLIGCGQQCSLGCGYGKYRVRGNVAVLEMVHKPSLLPESVKSLSQARIRWGRCQGQIGSPPLCLGQHGDDGLLRFMHIQAEFKTDSPLMFQQLIAAMAFYQPRSCRQHPVEPVTQGGINGAGRCFSRQLRQLLQSRSECQQVELVVLLECLLKGGLAEIPAVIDRGGCLLQIKAGG